ncbi:hypothetical protein BH09PLA1_BH09PLA1_35460 [soil metagenome]
MNRFSRPVGVFALCLIFLTSASTFAAAKKYQVTGKVIELTDKMIVVQTIKGDERWEIERSTDMKVEGELKVGAKVTIEYRMVAQNVEVKKDK